MTGKSMRLDYYLCDPLGNITVLVETPVPPSLLPQVGTAMMAAEPSAEQVGFLSADDGRSIRLRMAGDEFCGNATLSAGVCSLAGSCLSSGSCSVSVYGIDTPLMVTACMDPDSVWRGTAQMPLTSGVSVTDLSFSGRSYTLPLVTLGGISHLVTRQQLNPGLIPSALRAWCRELSVPALGLMQLSGGDSVLTPVVFVSALDTVFWEHSCASGTCASALVLSRERGKDGLFSFKEPGGQLGCHVSDGSLLLTGSVSIVKRSCEIYL